MEGKSIVSYNGRNTVKFVLEVLTCKARVQVGGNVRSMKSYFVHIALLTVKKTGWLVDCFGLNSLLGQYFSLYRAISQREGEKGEKMIDERKNVQTPPTRTYCKHSLGPCPTIIQISRTPQHWKLPSTITPPDHPKEQL